VSPPFSFSFLNNELLIGPSLGKKRKKRKEKTLEAHENRSFCVTM
jgi:hypothetical protein